MAASEEKARHGVAQEELSSAAVASKSDATLEPGQSHGRSQSRGLQGFLAGLQALGAIPQEVFHDPNDHLHGPSHPTYDGDLDYDQFEFAATQHQTPHQKAKRTMLRDKLSFVLGNIIVVVTAYWVGRSPSTLYRLYSLLTVILLGGRFFVYRKEKTHYFLFDFCYAANFVGVLLLWALPRLVPLWIAPIVLKMMFSFNAGPLLWSIPAMRNSLVYHSFDKLITLFIHAYPSLVSFTLHWYPDCHLQSTCDLPADSPEVLAFSNASLADLLLYPMLPYLIWLVGYYLVIFQISGKRISERGYTTVYSYWLQNKTHPMVKVVLSFPAALQPIVYLSLHLTLCWFAMSMTVIWWHLYVCHVTILILMLLWSCWNGAGFYFEVFAHKYIRSLGMELKPMKKS